MKTLVSFLPMIFLTIAFFAALCYYVYKGYVSGDIDKTESNFVSSKYKKLIDLRIGKMVDYRTNDVSSTTTYLMKDVIEGINTGIYFIVTHYFSVVLILSILIMLWLEFSILNLPLPIFGTSQHNLTDTLMQVTLLLGSWFLSDIFLKIFLCAFLKPKIPHSCILENYEFLLAYKTNHRRRWISNKSFLLGGGLLY